MSHPAPRVRRGAHRTRRNLAAAVVPSLLAVASVAALVTALYVWRGQDPAATGAAAAERTTTGAPTVTASATPPRASSAPATSAASSPRSSASRSAAPSSTPAVSSAAPVGHLEVVVLNQTRRKGLAHEVAQLLRARGWTVVKEGNFRGRVPATTVYYPLGAEADARAAASALPTTPRVRERFGNLAKNRLTVVVTDDYPG